MPEKKLIVTADDFGLTEGVNEGIIDAYRKGIVTRTSIIANGRAFAHAVSLAKRHEGLKVGIHLTLTEEMPINRADKIKSLTARHGKFSRNYKVFLINYIYRKINLNEVYNELDSQIRKVLSAEIKINHIDSHQHLHMLPVLFKITIDLAEKYKIKKIRFVRHNLMCIRSLKEAGLTLLAIINKRILFNSNMDFSDCFWGLRESGNLRELDILNFLDRIRAGTTEMICHPGYPDKDYLYNYSHWTYHPDAELKALISTNVMEKLKKMEIQLVS